MPHPALAHLPAAVFAMAPELATADLPQETRATCERCAMGAPRAQVSVDRPFDVVLKCCTFHPTHMNWLVGRALRRGGPGAEHTRERMRDGRKMTPVGILPPDSFVDAYRTAATHAFGRNPTFLCPYYADGACTVWRDRASVCRTWHCLHVDGQRGQELWKSVQLVLSAVERRLSAWCVLRLDPPDEPDWTDAAAMEAWFIHCADAVDALEPVQAATMRDHIVKDRVLRLSRVDALHMPDVPDVLGPSVTRFETLDDGEVRLGASSRLDTLRVPSTIFELLSRLDGHTPWAAALQATNEVVEDDYSAAFIEDLFRRGLLEERDPDAPDPEPGVTSSAIYYPADEEHQ